MARVILKESKREIIVNILRLGKPFKILTYFINLGTVSKRSYIQEEDDPFNYIAKNRDQLVRKNEEFIKKLKKWEVC